MSMHPPEGLALYLRRYIRREHGSPLDLMRRMKDNGAKWVAIGGPWQDTKGNRFINKPDTCQRLLVAADQCGLDGYVWGYPWMDREEQFADDMKLCAGDFNRALLDPELGSNPTRSRKGAGKARADAHAKRLVEEMAHRFDGGMCGLSTYGSGVKMRWFPFYAFARALAEHFPGRTFAGGQTYTDDDRIDPSIADFIRAIEDVADLDTIPLVPNFGTYSWKVQGDRRSGARSKRGPELDSHFLEFIDEGEPVEALIGWAENFMTAALWRSFAKMADRMERGACRL